MRHLSFYWSILRLTRSYSTLNAPHEAMRIGSTSVATADNPTNDDLETFRRRRKTDWKRRQGVRVTFIASLSHRFYLNVRVKHF